MTSRHRIFFIVIIVVVLCFVLRLLFLQVFQYDFFKEKSNKQLKRIINLYPHRGTILDRDLTPLATTQTSYQVYALPQQIDNKWVFAKQVSGVLDISKKELSDQLYKTTAPFIWVQRHCPEERMQELKRLNLTGIGFIKTEQRVYPQQEVAAHVLGFVGVDNQGLSGLEYHYDHLLKGSSGKIILDGDPRGNQLLSGKKTKIPHSDGQTLVTTIDSNVQFMAQTYLAQAVKKHQAESGQVIIMSPKTGDILAMANVPTFNNNEWRRSVVSDRRIRSISDVFEPGSIFKMITLASVIEEDIVSSKSLFNVPETYQLYNKVIKEAHEREPGEGNSKTVSEIMEQSLNVGTTLLALKLGEERLYKYIQDFGFGKKTGIELPGESNGILRPVKQWSGVDIGTISFGQGIAVTGIQIVSAYSAIANNGYYVKPRMIKYITDDDRIIRKAVPISKSKMVVSESTAYEVRNILHHVVTRGTAQSLQIPGYSIGGKTGTAQKPKKNGLGYEPGKYIASFVGFFPVEDPEIVMLVAIDSPQKEYYGSTVAGPVFKACAEFLIDYYHIMPSHLIGKTSIKQSTVN